MDPYTIYWGPETKDKKILVHLYNPLKEEIDRTWYVGSLDENAIEIFFVIKGSLPASERYKVRHIRALNFN